MGFLIIAELVTMTKVNYLFLAIDYAGKSMATFFSKIEKRCKLPRKNIGESFMFPITLNLAKFLKTAPKTHYLNQVNLPCDIFESNYITV